jgi:hypothetical protein
LNTVIPKSTIPWFMLFSRLLLFASIQSIFALAFYLTGSSNAWETSANWWPMVVVITNLVCAGLLMQIFQSKGKHYWDIFRFDRQHIKADLLVLLGITVLTAPVSILPNIVLGRWLFGNSNATLELFVRPLPFYAVYAIIILFPVSQGMTEIATYFGYIMPSFKENGMHLWFAVTLPALMLGLQHIAIPLLFDLRFILWRGLMYIPFAFLTGMVIHWRPRMLTYFAIVHLLLNLSFTTMFLNVAYH